jgi:heme/copper-type cytochrome/quinol oxidase subunit 2
MIEVAITPTKEGRHHFLCDNFCGDGHDAAFWSWLPG